MTRLAEMGANRTGIASAAELAAEMVQGTQEFPPSAPGDEQEIARVRGAYTKEAEPLGSVPPPILEPVPEQTAGEEALMAELIDKLGARLAFERSGVRLYSALLSKFDVHGTFPGGPERDDLEHMRDEELEHFHLLSGAVEELGGDPTAVTPAADLQATMTRGILDVLVDPRTTFVQGLEAILLAELADNDSWYLLSMLATQMGKEDLATDFEEAEANEREHLTRVRTWLLAASGAIEASSAE
jgi:rubrerythrin